VIIKLIFSWMIGSTHVTKFQDLTLTFLLRSYLRQHSQKLANFFKIFSRTVSARGEEKAIFIIYRGPFSSFVWGHFLLQIFFRLYFWDSRGMENHIFNKFCSIGFRAKNRIARVKEVIPNESWNVPVFDLYFNFKLRSQCLFLT
jgi:hypothetical protein